MFTFQEKSIVNEYCLVNNSNNYLLSKYHKMFNFIEISKNKFKTNFSVKYQYKNVEDALLLYWLFVIIFEKSPKAYAYKFKKRTIVFSISNVDSLYFSKFNDFIYNVNEIKYKKKKKYINFYSKNNQYLSYKEKNPKRISSVLCQFKASLKKEIFDYIFYDLGVTSFRIQANLKFLPYFNSMRFTDRVKQIRNLTFDQMSMKNIDNIIKAYFFYQIPE
jgi:hypothetical protein